MAIHLEIGGSTATRTINCPAWIERAKALPKPKAGAAADLGNLLHDAMENHFLHDQDFSAMVGKLEFNGIVLTQEHVNDFLIPAANAANEVLDKHDIDELFIEPFVQYQPGKIGGSIDLLGVSADGRTIMVLDYKFGQSWVPITTKQLPFYALCSSVDPLTRSRFDDAETLVYVIIQPARSDKPIELEQLIGTLDDFESELLDALNNPTRSAPGSHCQFCPAAPVCPDKKAQALAAKVLPTETAQELAEALTLANELEPWIKEVQRRSLDIALDGGQIPGFKLVEGRAVRQYNEKAEKKLLEILGDNAYTKKIRGITEAEKLIGKKAFSELAITDTPPGKLKLVSEQQKGEAVKITTPSNLEALVNNHYSN